MTHLKDILPGWAHPWIDLIAISLQSALVILAALLLRSLLHRFINRLGREKQLPLELIVGSRRLVSFILISAALLLIMDRLGVSGTVIWTAFTGFATVAAVAFFAAWSVLSNIFCALLIFVTRPFGLHDHIELLEGGDKPGLGGEVMDINLIYTTLREEAEPGKEPSWLRVPNSLFFQRTVRLRSVREVSRSPIG
ncbi:MAG: mechanosensitive ion channel family protein [Ottowia sp.]|uniref:mechanosensitive ion channel domain-containing protein n=1 Tax=Ottowia sp. TaxID=1898956 RepID=UPI003C717431